jgi:hypothetical protein
VQREISRHSAAAIEVVVVSRTILSKRSRFCARRSVDADRSANRKRLLWRGEKSVRRSSGIAELANDLVGSPAHLPWRQTFWETVIAGRGRPLTAADIASVRAMTALIGVHFQWDEHRRQGKDSLRALADCDAGLAGKEVAAKFRGAGRE